MNFLKSTWSWVGSGFSASEATAEEIQAPETKPEDGSVGSTLWQIIGSKLGGDVLRIGVSLPSWMYEPLSMLQRQAEMIEYGDVLSTAAKCTDPYERMAYVIGFAVSGYSATQRYRPNFNPMLGETFEFHDARHNTRFFAEQVSHHPPVSALHVQGDNWNFTQNSTPTTRFLGNAIDVQTNGNSHVYFTALNEHIQYSNPCTRCNSIIIGSRWIEHFGELSFKNLTNGITCVVTFRKAGLFQGPQYQIEGFIMDKAGKKIVRLEGRWDQYLTAEWLEDSELLKKGDKRNLWRVAPDNFIEGHQYGFSKFTALLNEFGEDAESFLPLTDSRRRLDRYYLEKGDTDAATRWKRAMEDRQRGDRKTRKDEWKPVWFEKKPIPDHVIQDSEGNLVPMEMWQYTGDYWEQRDKKRQLIREGLDAGQYTNAPLVCGQACDFTSYEPSSNSTTTTETTLTDTDSDDTEANSNSNSPGIPNGDAAK